MAIVSISTPLPTLGHPVFWPQELLKLQEAGIQPSLVINLCDVSTKRCTTQSEINQSGKEICNYVVSFRKDVI